MGIDLGVNDEDNVDELRVSVVLHSSHLHTRASSSSSTPAVLRSTSGSVSSSTGPSFFYSG